jgi:hypothetical protein
LCLVVSFLPAAAAPDNTRTRTVPVRACSLARKLLPAGSGSRLPVPCTRAIECHCRSLYLLLDGGERGEPFALAHLASRRCVKSVSGQTAHVRAALPPGAALRLAMHSTAICAKSRTPAVGAGGQYTLRRCCATAWPCREDSACAGCCVGPSVMFVVVVAAVRLADSMETPASDTWAPPGVAASSRPCRGPSSTSTCAAVT